ncbi:Mov34/MPN/PAD-1 family protein [Longispora sp. K20-0274]|uniref:Mov34/MPN/PAD-1 family protein n=1 Tax=Longispora sp. K20-0274 TaxID=3088255 RepID=UPI00399A8772
MTFSISPQRRELPQYSPQDLAAFLADGPDLRLVVEENALSGIRRQAAAGRLREVGGVLVGRHYQLGDRYLVHIQDHVAVPSGSSGAVHFDFDESSIQAILAHLDLEPDRYVVGWYHSHLGGPPFMSQLDDRLHSGHFTQPWHISCVVSAGSWGRVAGFWRMTDGVLEAINDYALSIVTQGSPSEQQSRFIAACGITDPSAENHALGIMSLLPDLGVGDESPLVQAVMAGDTKALGADGLADVTFLVRAALAAAANPAVVKELETIGERLRVLRLFTDVVTPTLIARVLTDRVSIGGGECYSYSPESRQLHRIGLEDGWLLPVRVSGMPQWICHSPDGTGWIVTNTPRLIRLPRVDKETWLAGDTTYKIATTELPGLSGPPVELAVREGTAWVRCAGTWHVFDLTSDPEEGIAVESLRSGPLPTPNCVLVGGNGMIPAEAPPHLLGIDAERLCLWTMDERGWQLTAAAPLAEPWPSARILQCVLTGQGWHLLLDTGDGQHMLLADRHNLTVLHRLVRTREQQIVADLTALTGDGSGQVYVLAGQVLYRG